MYESESTNNCINIILNLHKINLIFYLEFVSIQSDEKLPKKLILWFEDLKKKICLNFLLEFYKVLWFGYFDLKWNRRIDYK